MAIRCQCDPQCTNKPLPNLPFCKKHMSKCTRKAIPSESTPPYQPELFNKHEGVQRSLNCYAYAMGYRRLPKSCTLNVCDETYPQPGRTSGYPDWSKVKGKRCPDILARIMGDIPAAKMSTFTAKCPRKSRKIAVVADAGQDYHFYRQDADGYWSHKPGATKVTRLDTSGRPIYDPFLAERDNKVSNLNYKHFCGYMCIPSDKNKIKLRRGGYSKKALAHHSKKALAHHSKKALAHHSKKR